MEHMINKVRMSKRLLDILHSYHPRGELSETASPRVETPTLITSSWHGHSPTTHILNPPNNHSSLCRSCPRKATLSHAPNIYLPKIYPCFIVPVWDLQSSGRVPPQFLPTQNLSQLTTTSYWLLRMHWWISEHILCPNSVQRSFRPCGQRLRVHAVMGGETGRSQQFCFIYRTENLSRVCVICSAWKTKKSHSGIVTQTCQHSQCEARKWLPLSLS